MGRQLGEVTAGDIRSFNNRFFSDAFNLMRFGSMENVEKYVRRVGLAVKDYSPSTYELLAGMAEGADLPIEQILMQSIMPELTHVGSAEDWAGPVGGCTACCVRANATAGNGAIIGQCWDFNIDLPDWYVARLSPPLGLPEMLIVGMGAFFCCCGINSFGLGVTFTASGHLPNVKPSVGVPVVGVFMEALSCENYFEAMDLMVAPKRAGAMNMLLSDGYSENTLFEVAGDQAEMIGEEPILVCGNHFQHPKVIELTQQNLEPTERAGSEFARSSVQRTERLRTLLTAAPKESIDAKFVKNCLKDHEHYPLSICAHEEETILHFRTQGAMIIEPTLRTIEFCPTQPCKGEFESFSL
jgi:isopenicillin-N N-acyltransferase-like protein